MAVMYLLYFVLIYSEMEMEEEIQSDEDGIENDDDEELKNSSGILY